MSRIAEAFSSETYGGLPGFKEPTTSKAAAVAVASSAETLREDVYAVIRLAGPRGLTADEAAAMLDKSVLAVRPRVSELRKALRIEPTGERRKNDSGMSAMVWRVA